MEKKSHIINFNSEKAVRTDIAMFKRLWEKLKVEIVCLPNDYGCMFIKGGEE